MSQRGSGASRPQSGGLGEHHSKRDEPSLAEPCSNQLWEQNELLLLFELSFGVIFNLATNTSSSRLSQDLHLFNHLVKKQQQLRIIILSDSSLKASFARSWLCGIEHRPSVLQILASSFIRWKPY